MAVPGLNRDLVAVEQSIGGVVEMSVAESECRSERGDRIDGLNRIDKRRVREPRNVSDRTQLTAAEHVRARQTTICAATGGETESRDTAKGANREGTVGQVGEGVA